MEHPSAKNFNILVLGSGAREHALCWKLAQSPLLSTLYVAPGNAGMENVAKIKDISLENHSEIIAFCKSHAIHMVVIGPEAPLVSGIVDLLEAESILVVGPSRKAAQLEASKDFTHYIADTYNIPMARYKSFMRKSEALAYVTEQSLPIVIKADGLAAGKGVVIASSYEEATTAIERMLDGQFGKASEKIVIEEFMEGEELSFFALCNGEDALFLGAAQDHKKVGENDTGLNTGGMGAYSPTPYLNDALKQHIMQHIIEPTLKGMKKEGALFKGILFAGIMLTETGPKLLEFNVRMGDPETQVIMVRMKSDLLAVLVEFMKNNNKIPVIEWKDEAALCVVMATKNYPNLHVNGSLIKNLEAVNQQNNVLLFHAATQKSGNDFTAQGGRVLSVTALGSTLKEAQKRAYDALKLVDWPEGFYRKDIGWRAL